MKMTFAEFAKDCKVGDRIQFRKNARVWTVVIKHIGALCIKGPYTDDHGNSFPEGMFIIDGTVEVIEGPVMTDFKETVAKFVEASRL